MTQTTEAGISEPTTQVAASIDGKKKRHRRTNAEIAEDNKKELEQKYRQMKEHNELQAEFGKNFLVMKLHNIRKEIQAPKDQQNVSSTGRTYSYRSLGGIYEALKPLLEKYECDIIINDRVEHHSDKFNYIVSEVRFYSLFPVKGDEAPMVFTGMAREAEDVYGFDPAQVTGSATTYARKSALSAMLLLNASSDPDANPVIDGRRQTNEVDVLSNGDIVPAPPKPMVSAPKKAPLAEKAASNGDLPVLEMNAEGYLEEIERIKNFQGSKDEYLTDLRTRFVVSDIEFLKLASIYRKDFSSFN